MQQFEKDVKPASSLIVMFTRVSSIFPKKKDPEIKIGAWNAGKL